MDWDELEPRKAKPQLRNLEPLSVEALTEYIGELEAEIDRVKAAIEIKKSARMGAESFFKK